MQILIRADASLEIGTGHVIRCLTLARVLREKGAKCEFICRAHEGHLIEYIVSEGFSVHVLSMGESLSCVSTNAEPNRLAHAGWLGATSDEDANECLEKLTVRRFNWLIVDHYGIDQRWELLMRKICQHIMVVDDLADREHDCDILLDQNLGRLTTDYSSLVPFNCQRLIGPDFSLLRSEFYAERISSLKRKSRIGIRRLLLTMGGIDRDNLTSQVLHGLLESHVLPEDCIVQVVMGTNAPWLADVKTLAEKLPWQCEVFVGVSNMAQLMCEADLAIGTVGATAWERCCLGLPTLAVIAADNQREGAESLAEIGAVKILPIGSGMVDALSHYFNELRNPEKMTDMHDACYAVTDGLGTEKVARALLSNHIWIDSLETNIRQMRISDLSNVRAWRNHPDIRKYMHTQHDISESEHRAWFRVASSDPKRSLLIYELNLKPLGFLQFSQMTLSGRAEWGFYLAPSAPKGIGFEFGQKALKYGFVELNLTAIHGEVMVSNEKSLRFHEKLGFQKMNNKDSKFVKFELTKECWAAINERNKND